VIAEVIGRSTDFVVRPDGTIMHALAVIYVLRALEGIREFKVVQHELNRVEVQVVPDQRWRAETLLAIEQGLKARLGADVRIETRLIDQVAPEASGKHRYVVSRVRVGLVDDAKISEARPPATAALVP